MSADNPDAVYIERVPTFRATQFRKLEVEEAERVIRWVQDLGGEAAWVPARVDPRDQRPLEAAHIKLLVPEQYLKGRPDDGIRWVTVWVKSWIVAQPMPLGGVVFYPEFNDDFNKRFEEKPDGISR